MEEVGPVLHTLWKHGLLHYFQVVTNSNDGLETLVSIAQSVQNNIFFSVYHSDKKEWRATLSLTAPRDHRRTVELFTVLTTKEKLSLLFSRARARVFQAVFCKEEIQEYCI